MNSALAKRVTVLENASASNGPEAMTILVIAMLRADSVPDLRKIRQQGLHKDREAPEWVRAADESIDDFTSRAEREAIRRPGNVVLLMQAI